MCDPTVLALSSLAIKTAGNLGAAAAQNNAADANKKSAIASEAGSINDINLRETQEKQAAGQQIEAAQRQTRTAVSSARLSAGEAGVSGASVDALLSDIGAKGSTYAGDVKLNLQNTNDQLERQKLGIYSQTQDRINSVQKSNPFATALTIGGSAIGTLTQLAQQNNVPSDGTPSAGATSSLRIGPPNPVVNPIMPESRIRGR